MSTGKKVLSETGVYGGRKRWQKSEEEEEEKSREWEEWGLDGWEVIRGDQRAASRTHYYTLVLSVLC